MNEVLKPGKGGTNETKRKIFGWNIEKGYQKPPIHPLIPRTHLHASHPHPKLLANKKQRK